ncbi:MAG: fibronectin type III domain-containing protein [Acidobacteriota bacterium]
MQARYRLAAVVLSAAVALLAGCGRKGDPLPPIVEVPETTTDLAVYQDLANIVLTWSYPQLTRAGRPLVDLERIEVWRMEVPPGQERMLAGPTGEQMKLQLMLARAKLIAKLEGPGLAKATRGSQLEYDDPVPAVAPGTTPPTLCYGVRSRRRDGTYSAPSNLVCWQPHPVPSAVTGLTATPSAKGIVLAWGEVKGAGYLVERRDAVGSPWQMVTATPVPSPGFTDAGAAQGRTWDYRVQAVVDGARGPRSDEVRVAYPDVYPPPVPSGLICLPEQAAVQLRWDPSPEPGVVYRVSRRVGTGSWDELERTWTSTEYTDRTPVAKLAEYAVKAVDAAGNASAAAACSARAGQ